MSSSISPQRAIIYPESDGQPMAENTLQFRWIVTIKENLETLFQANPDVFIAGDLFWYPVEGAPEIRRAPDTLVVFGRPKGHRGSYRQWDEADIPPHVVFEILSPSNRFKEMLDKLEFYDTHGVEEYYLYDPETNDLTGLRRQAGRLRAIEQMDGWISPRLGIRFDLSGAELLIVRPDGERFLSHQELRQQREEAQQQAERAKQQAELAKQQAELAEERAHQAEQQREAAEQRAAQLAAHLRTLGIDPDTLTQHEG